MLEIERLKRESVIHGDEAQVGKTVFKAVREALSAEAEKVEAELARQLDVIFRDLKSKDREVWGDSRNDELLENSFLRVKRDVKQLFVYLERVMVLNVTQDLCSRLKSLAKAQNDGIVGDHTERERSGERIRRDEARTAELSRRISENEKKTSQRRDGDEESGTDVYARIRDGVESLLNWTHDAASMLENLSKKCSELRNENVKLKQRSES